MRISFSRLVTSSLIRRYWLIVPVFMLIAIILGVIEHLLIRWGGEDIHILYDVVIYTLLLTLGSWVTLGLLKESEKNRDAAERRLNLRQNFSRQLSESRDWDDLVRKVVSFPHHLVPECTVSLYLFDPEKSNFHLKAICAPNGEISLNSQEISEKDLPRTISSSQICANPVILNALAEERSIHLPTLIVPFNRSEKCLGVLRMDFAEGVVLLPQVLNLFHSIGDEVATALESMGLQNVAINQAIATEDERRKIARELHDTLAQNIGYLRLKLEHLTGEQSVLGVSNILSELSRMRDIADEAYQQVRSTLDQLTYSSEKDLVSALVNHARVVGGRAKFEVIVNQIGVPKYVPLFMRRQIFFIARESLNNIEKHAEASCVHLQIVWREQDLVLKISDNGQGYDTQKTNPSGHYGLMIMQERAHEIGGYLAVSSTPGKGTEVTLRIPLGVPVIAEL